MTKLSHSYSAMKMFDNCPLRYKMQRVDKKIVDPGGDASLYGERVHKSLEDRLKDGTALPAETARYEGLVTAVENKMAHGDLRVEQEYTLNENFEPTGWWDADAWFRSKLDVLVLFKNTAVVLDWKTGKHRPDFEQLELFAMQVFYHHPEINRVRCGFIWLKDGMLDSQVYTRDNLSAYVDNLLTKVHRIENALKSDTWPAKPSGLCRFCPAYSFCDYAAT